MVALLSPRTANMRIQKVAFMVSLAILSDIEFFTL